MNSKIITAIALFIGLLIAIVLAIQVGQGEFKTVYVTMLLIFSVPIVLLLGLRSWYILPFAMLAELPAIPLIGDKAVSLSEFGIALFSGLMVLAVIQGKELFRVKLGDWWPMLLYGAWVLMIAMINGGGFAILGSASMGGRRHLTVFIALIGMLMLSQIKIREKEAKRVCWLIVASIALSGLYMAVSTMIGRFNTQVAHEFYSWQQGLSSVGLGGVLLLFAKHSPSRVMRSPLYAILYMTLLAVVIYSGKRMTFGACCVIPIIACFWHRQAIIALVVTLAGALIITSAVWIQNEVTPIPKSMQRVLAFIPADWDWDVKDSTINTFRETLNRWAVIYIEENPVLGKGVSLTGNDFALMSDPQYISQIKLPDDDILAFPHIAGKNWHSTWLGLAASFGIPLAVFWVFVQLFVLRGTWKLGHKTRLTDWRSVLMGILFFLMCVGVIRAMTSGDVAVLAMAGGLTLGLMSAVKNGLREEWREENRKTAVDNA